MLSSLGDQPRRESTPISQTVKTWFRFRQDELFFSSSSTPLTEPPLLAELVATTLLPTKILFFQWQSSPLFQQVFSPIFRAPVPSSSTFGGADLSLSILKVLLLIVDSFLSSRTFLLRRYFYYEYHVPFLHRRISHYVNVHLASSERDTMGFLSSPWLL